MKKAVRFLFEVVGFCALYFLFGLIIGKEYVWYEIVIQGILAMAIAHGLRCMYDHIAKV